MSLPYIYMVEFKTIKKRISYGPSFFYRHKKKENKKHVKCYFSLHKYEGFVYFILYWHVIKIK